MADLIKRTTFKVRDAERRKSRVDRRQDMLRLLALAAVLYAAPVTAQQIEPWIEAVVSVDDIADATRLFRDVGGWRVTHKGKMSRAELKYWKLPAKASASFERLCAPDTNTGCIRFVSFKGVEQRPIRRAARPWDSGGIFSIMIRSDNADALFEQALAMDWWAESEPINFDFGGSKLRNVVLTGPHGINIAVYERREPPFTAFPVGRISQGFNTMRMVRDQKAAVSWYREKLGFGLLFDADYLDPAPQVTNFSVPINLSTTIPRRAAVVHPEPGETGRIELMQFVGFEGRDFAAHASPPNLGIISVRFPVVGLADYRAKLEANSVAIAYEAINVELKGIGKVNLLAVRDPDGNISEFYETVPKGK
jgi:catechol 2,3-dioxygenase-like lactoylglutathione lyase family enzyme